MVSAKLIMVCHEMSKTNDNDNIVNLISDQTVGETQHNDRSISRECSSAQRHRKRISGQQRRRRPRRRHQQRTRSKVRNHIFQNIDNNI